MEAEHKKKVLFVAPSLRLGGMEQILVTIANQLSEHGYEVTIILLQDNDTLKYKLNSRVSVIHRTPKKLLGKKIPYIRHKLYDDGMWERRVSVNYLHRYYVGKEHYDVEIAFFRGMTIKIVSGCTDPNTVRLAWVHNDFRQAKGYLNNFGDIQEVYRAYATFDRVVCVSEQARQGFIETVGNTGNTQTIYNMIPVAQIRRLAEEKPAFEVPKGKLNLVIVARLEDRAKGQIRLIQTVARLHDEGEELTLTVVGGGADEAKLHEEIERRHAGAYITLTGAQNNPYPYIKGADLLVCASYYEGYNLTVAEALVLGTPVFSTDCTGPSEILDGGKYGMIVDNSAEGLYHGLKKLCGSPDLLKKYREKAHQRIDFFNEKKILDQITSLFEGGRDAEDQRHHTRL